jgi:hypothetical protein
LALDLEANSHFVLPALIGPHLINPSLKSIDFANKNGQIELTHRGSLELEKEFVPCRPPKPRSPIGRICKRDV